MATLSKRLTGDAPRNGLHDTCYSLHLHPFTKLTAQRSARNSSRLSTFEILGNERRELQVYSVGQSSSPNLTLFCHTRNQSTSWRPVWLTRGWRKEVVS